VLRPLLRRLGLAGSLVIVASMGSVGTGCSGDDCLEVGDWERGLCGQNTCCDSNAVCTNTSNWFDPDLKGKMCWIPDEPVSLRLRHPRGITGP